MRYDPPDTSAGRDVMESIRRGDVTGSSFMFKPVVNTYREVDKLYIVERNEVMLFDVGPVNLPRVHRDRCRAPERSRAVGQVTRGRCGCRGEGTRPRCCHHDGRIAIGPQSESPFPRNLSPRSESP